MRIVLVNQYVGPERYCPAFRPTHLARHWAKGGHDVTIIGASYSHLFHEQPAGVSSKTTLDEGGVRFVMVPTPAYQGNGLSRARNLAAFVLGLYRMKRRVVETLKPDLIVVGSVHGLDVPPCRAWASALGARLVRDVRDLWPLTLTELHGLGRNHPFARVLGAAERYSYRVVDTLTTTLPHSLPHMEAAGLMPARWHYIPHGVDVEQWDAFDGAVPELHRTVIERLRQEGRLVVAFTGSHVQTAALDVLIAAAGLAARSVGVVLVGGGPEKIRLERLAAACAGSVSFLPPMPRSAIKSFLELADVAYLGWRESRLYDFGISPNKLMDYMLARRPVVHAVGKTNDLVAESGCGRSVPPESADALAEAFEWMREAGPIERARLGTLGRDYVASRFPYDRISKDYLEAVS